MNYIPLRKGIKFGIIGSLVGTVIMDLVQIAMMAAIGEPLGSFYGRIGEAVGTLLTEIGIDVVGGIPIGVVVHYLLGLALGVVFGLMVTRVHALRVNTTRRGILLGILFAEATGLVLFLPVPLLLEIEQSDLAIMFVSIVLFHALYGAVTGGVTSYGLRSR
jgi:hypothetical protein